MVGACPKAATGPLVMLAAILAVAATGAAAARGGVRRDVLPVTKAVRLLQEMQRDLEREAKEDADTWEKLTCWCKENEKKKTASIEQARQQIDALDAKIEEGSGRVGELTTSLDQVKAAMAESEAALRAATEIREEEAAQFHEQEKELLESIELLRGAIIVLAKHHPSMIQSADHSELSRLRPALRHLIHGHLKQLGWLRGARARDALLGFLDAHADILDPDGGPMLLQRSSGDRRAVVRPQFRAYAPQSGEILGVLQQMKESFEADLPQIQRDEIVKQTNFAELKASKTTEISQLKEQKKSKTALLARTREELIWAKSDLEDTKASVSADQRFLLRLTERCAEGGFEWERRRKLRLEEIAAVADAIKILTTDEAKDGQQTTFGLIQVETTRQGGGPAAGAVPAPRARRGRAAALLSGLVRRAPQLLALKMSIQKDPFAKVIEAIDGLIAKLKIEQEDEVKHHDFCKGELHENDVQTARKTHELETLDAKAKALATQAQGLSEEIAGLKADIASLQVELQRASEDRKVENMEFRKTVADQMRMHYALEQAHSRLAAFYAKRVGLLQRGPAEEAAGGEAEPSPVPAADPAPEFQDYHDHASSNSVMTLLKKLAGEANVFVDGSVHDEQQAQAAYEQLIKETSDSVEAKTRGAADRAAELATVREEEHRTRGAAGQVSRELEALADTKATLHQQCDFLLANFGARQDARAAELEGLASVKAILRGMGPES